MGTLGVGLAIEPGKRQTVTWQLKVPGTALPGKYEIDGEVYGTAFKRYERSKASTVITVKE